MFDVAVIGGGPAGAIFALRMARLGHAVCLIERERFPRRHLGESLTPGVLPLLASLGLGGVAASATPVRAVGTNWEGEERERRDPEGLGLLVDRGVFDAALLAAARRDGVEVRQPAALRCASEGEGGWTLAIEGEDGAGRVEARFLADASGRSSHLAARRRATGPRTFAVHGWWRGRGLPQTPRIEAVAGGWCWGVPIPDGSYNTLAFVDEARLRAVRAGPREAWLTGLLAGTTIARQLGGATRDGPARISDATPYLDEACVGPRRIRVGEAALALDPLSSSGVQRAIQSALAGAIVAHTLLSDAGDAALAQRFWIDHLEAASARHAAWARDHYGVAGARFDDPFWRARAASAPGGVQSARAPGERMAQPAAAPDPLRDAPLRLSAQAHWREVPCLGAERVELRRALVHPGLDGPIAFVGGHALAALLGGLPESCTPSELARRWAADVPSEQAHRLTRWLCARGVLEPAPRDP